MDKKKNRKKKYKRWKKDGQFSWISRTWAIASLEKRRSMSLEAVLVTRSIDNSRVIAAESEKNGEAIRM